MVTIYFKSLRIFVTQNLLNIPIFSRYFFIYLVYFVKYWTFSWPPKVQTIYNLLKEAFIQVKDQIIFSTVKSFSRHKKKLIIVKPIHFSLHSDLKYNFILLYFTIYYTVLKYYWWFLTLDTTNIVLLYLKKTIYLLLLYLLSFSNYFLYHVKGKINDVFVHKIKLSLENLLKTIF